MKQTPSTQFMSECGKAKIVVDNDMAAGAFHDFVLKAKGYAVDLMIKAQKEDEEIQEYQKKQSESENISEG